MKVALFGSPGVGKGTYAARLREDNKLLHISTGDLFRAEVKESTPLGKEAKKYMDAGKLVPDEVTIGMLKKRIAQKDAKNGFLLDGFPRTVEQAEALDTITKLDAVVNYIAKDETIIQRLSGRRICKKCAAIYHIKNVPTKKPGICDKCGGEVYQRDDDLPESVKKRLVVYHSQTKPVLDYYKNKKILYEVDANLDISDPKAHIVEDTQDILNKFK